MRYAGFWIRFAAVFLDGILTGIVTQILGLMIGIMVGVSAGDDPNAAMVAGLLGVMIGIAIPCAYETILVGKYSATLGKMACGVKVMRPDGSQLTYLRAFARYWAKSLSALILLIGYIMAAFDDEKRALHDRVCDTRVVKK